MRLAERLERPNSERSDLIACAQAGCNVRVEHGRCDEHRQGIAEAIKAFRAAHTDLGHGTQRNHKRALQFFQGHVEGLAIKTVDRIPSSAIDSFRTARKIRALTWTKELQILRYFFRFCIKNRWTSENPAADVSMPKNIKPTDKEPYSREGGEDLAACEAFGQYPYERLRARAMVLLLRYTALRIWT